MSIIKFERVARLQLLKSLSSNSYKQVRFYVIPHVTNQTSSEKILKLVNSNLNNVKLPFRKLSTSNISNNKDKKYEVKNNEETGEEDKFEKYKQVATWNSIYWLISASSSLIIFEIFKKKYKPSEEDNSITYDGFVDTYLKCGQVDTLYVSGQVAVVKLKQDAREYEDNVPPKIFPVVGGFVDGSDLIRKLSLESPHSDNLNVEHNEERCKEAKSDIVSRRWWKNAEYFLYFMNIFTLFCVCSWNNHLQGWENVLFVQMFRMFKK